MRRAYTMVVMFFQFVAPFVLMAFCYASIFARLRNRARVRLRRIDARTSVFEQQSIVVSNEDESIKNGVSNRKNGVGREASVKGEQASF